MIANRRDGLRRLIGDEFRCLLCEKVRAEGSAHVVNLPWREMLQLYAVNTAGNLPRNL
jgi:hypothetical protein